MSKCWLFYNKQIVYSITKFDMVKRICIISILNILITLPNKLSFNVGKYVTIKLNNKILINSKVKY